MAASSIKATAAKQASVAKRKAFQATLSRAFAKAERLGLGCLHCSTGVCYSSLAPKVLQIKQWRQEFAALPSNACRDQQLCYMFWHAAPHPGILDATSDTPSSDSHSSSTKRARASFVKAPRSDTDTVDESSNPPTHRAKTQVQQSGWHSPTSSVEESAVPGPQRVSTSSSGTESEPLDVADGHAALEDTLPAKQQEQKRKYNDGAARHAKRSIQFLDQAICIKAAQFFVGVGNQRLYRIKHGRVDGRTDRVRRTQGPGGISLQARQMPLVLRFLWRLYHSAGEGMPDRFSFERRDCRTLALSFSGACKRGACHQGGRTIMLGPDSKEGEDATGEAQLEEEERAITAAVLYAENTRLPPEATVVGPGMLGGPLRFLPPGKKVHLYWEFCAWCTSQGLGAAASFHTFLRAFSKCRDKLRIRKAGTHAVCDTCASLKRAIRVTSKSPKARQHSMEAYTKHILDQWLDRQVYWNAMELSLQCREMLRAGRTLSVMARSISQLCLIVDGADQAKFRVPRVLIKTHALDRLLRPALHIQGAWGHGFGYHLGVSDADCPKDTNSNVEVIARFLSAVYDTHNGLPLGLHLQQDNTSRECKNQFMVKFAAKLVSMGVFQWVTLSYLISGHTHENLHATFGQLTVKLSALAFDDDLSVIDVLLRLLGELGIDRSSRQASLAYKVDEAADWHAWWNEGDFRLSQLTGPDAPHWFRICRLKDLAEDGAPLTSAPGMPPPRPDDVVMAIKDRMSSPSTYQRLRLIPAEDANPVMEQPPGVRPRRSGGEDVKAKTARVARDLHRTGSISDAAHDYLVGWAEGTRAKQPRPAEYSFLRHRPHVQPAQPGGRARPRVPRLVQVHGRSGRPLPAHQPDVDEAEPGDLVEQG